MAENKKSVEELEAELAALKAEKETLLSSNSELQNQLEESQKNVDQVVAVVTHEKKKYKLLGKKIQVKGKVYDHEGLKKDKEVVAHLVKTGSDFLKEI